MLLLRHTNICITVSSAQLTRSLSTSRSGRSIDVSGRMMPSRISSQVGSTAPTLKIALWFDDTVLSYKFNSSMAINICRLRATSSELRLLLYIQLTLVKKIMFSEINCFIHEALYPFGEHIGMFRLIGRVIARSDYLVQFSLSHVP